MRSDCDCGHFSPVSVAGSLFLSENDTIEDEKMSETNDPKVRQETPEERERRLRKQRLRREARRRRRRRALLIRGALVVAAVAFVIILVILISGRNRKHSEKEVSEKGNAEMQKEIAMETVDTQNVLHLSFLSLIADPDTAFGQENEQNSSVLDQSRLTVDEFNQILQQLYDQGYMLVSLTDLAEFGEEGVMTVKELQLPQGKKPLLISQQNVSYDLEYSGQGIASRLVIDDNGKITSERMQSDGTIITGAFDIVPCVDAFIEEHPDFSHNGARGILGLTGYNGILGYRTEKALASSEGNKYASKYGVFDTTEETEAVKPIITALKNEGWVFACNGYGNISYASDLEKIKADMQQWKNRVESLLGEVNILIYPYGTDIEDESTYGSDNEKYTYLKNQGFRYFSAMNIGSSRTQTTEEYYRCNYKNLDGYRMYQDLYMGAGRFTGILDFVSVYDQSRPSVPAENSEGDGGEKSNDDLQEKIGA